MRLAYEGASYVDMKCSSFAATQKFRKVTHFANDLKTKTQICSYLILLLLRMIIIQETNRIYIQKRLLQILFSL